MFCSNGFDTMHVVCTDLFILFFHFSIFLSRPFEARARLSLRERLDAWIEASLRFEEKITFAEESAVNKGLGTPMFWKPLCLWSTPEGLDTTNYQLA